MKKINILIISFFGLFILTSCTANNSQITIENNVTTFTDSKLDNLIKTDLDKADDLYIELKSTDDTNSEELFESAVKLAKAHMAKKEFIIANFYIQEALSYKPYDESLKFLLVKNQYLAAINHTSDQSYLERALKALKENQNLLTDYDYIQKSQNLIDEVKKILAKSYLRTSQIYKREKKFEAEKLYLEKINNLGIDVETIRDKQ